MHYRTCWYAESRVQRGKQTYDLLESLFTEFVEVILIILWLVLTLLFEIGQQSNELLATLLLSEYFSVLDH